jgi:hypothetical protein
MIRVDDLDYDDINDDDTYDDTLYILCSQTASLGHGFYAQVLNTAARKRRKLMLTAPGSTRKYDAPQLIPGSASGEKDWLIDGRGYERYDAVEGGGAMGSDSDSDDESPDMPAKVWDEKRYLLI